MDSTAESGAPKFVEGVPCSHPGCFNHLTHPCDGCGRIGGHSYVMIPVGAARDVAEKYRKSMVVINAWDSVYGCLHTTTYGVSADQKAMAADAGTITARALNPELLHKNVQCFEDYRLTEAKTLLAVLKAMATFHGAHHREGCSEDDTCDCEFKPFNDLVNRTTSHADQLLGETPEALWQ